VSEDRLVIVFEDTDSRVHVIDFNSIYRIEVVKKHVYDTKKVIIFFDIKISGDDRSVIEFDVNKKIADEIVLYWSGHTKYRYIF
jgi:hypothetical protein